MNPSAFTATFTHDVNTGLIQISGGQVKTVHTHTQESSLHTPHSGIEQFNVKSMLILSVLHQTITHLSLKSTLVTTGRCLANKLDSRPCLTQMGMWANETDGPSVSHTYWTAGSVSAGGPQIMLPECWVGGLGVPIAEASPSPKSIGLCPKQRGCSPSSHSTRSRRTALEPRLW